MIELVNYIRQVIYANFEYISFLLISVMILFLFAFIYVIYQNICEMLIKLVKKHFVRIDVSMNTNELIDLAQQIWKIETKLNEVEISETKLRAIKSALSKIYSIFSLYNLKIKDYTGEKYNEGLNVEIRATVKEEKIIFPYIKETISPMITIDNNIIKKAEVIKAININDEE